MALPAEDFDLGPDAAPRDEGPPAPTEVPPPGSHLRGGAADWDNLIEGQIVFDKYTVVRKLGGGGMGVVWLVEHRGLGVERALKFVRSVRAVDPWTLGRLRMEALVMASFTHPNAVVVHDSYVRGDGAAYIEMEYIRGQGLDEVLRPAVPMPLDWTARILKQLCGVLHEAHERGIVHRDLKPSNLMLVEGRAEDESLKVLDFGIAKILGGEAPPDAVSTPLGPPLGSPPYMSPEQVDPSRGPLDRRSDLYTVGVILYEFLVGVRPFAGSISGLHRHHLETPPPPMSEQNPAARVPPAVERVVLRCLAKDPDQRPPTAIELWREFEASLAGPATGTSPPPPDRRATPPEPDAPPDWTFEFEDQPPDWLVDAPDAVELAEITHVGGAVRLRWNRPGRGAVRLFHWHKDHPNFHQVIPAQDLARLGHCLNPEDTDAETLDLTVPADQCWSIGLVTVDGATATAGRTVELTGVPEVTSLECRLHGGAVLARWTWPEGIQDVRVVVTADRRPDGRGDATASIHQDWTRVKYDLYGGFYLRPGLVPSARQFLHVAVQARTLVAGRARLATAWTAGSHRRLEVRRYRTVRYALKTRRGFFTEARWELVLTPDADLSLPALVLRGREDDQVPLNKDDGRDLLHIHAGTYCSRSPRRRLRLRVNRPKTEGTWVLRLFPLDDAECDYLLLVPAGHCWPTGCTTT